MNILLDEDQLLIVKAALYAVQIKSNIEVEKYLKQIRSTDDWEDLQQVILDFSKYLDSDVLDSKFKMFYNFAFDILEQELKVIKT